MAVLPDNVLIEEAAALPVAGLTALRTLRHGAPLLGRRVLVTGAAGGVGHLATQIAARSGARVTAVVGGPERGRHLRGAGEIVEGIDKVQGNYADPRIRWRVLPRRRNRSCRRKGNHRRFRQLVGRADAVQLSRFG
jgi:NADPH:quinone reductase-like Zn-dependent oxidoreductase